MIPTKFNYIYYGSTIFILISFLTISITLSFYWYVGTELSCHINSCNNTDYGSVLNISTSVVNQTICSSDNCPDSKDITCYYNDGHLVIDRPYRIDIIITTMVFFGCAFSLVIFLITIYLLSKGLIVCTSLLAVIFVIICFFIGLGLIVTGTPTAGTYTGGGSWGTPSGHTYCQVQSCQVQSYGNIFNLSLGGNPNVYNSQVCSLQSCPNSNVISCYIHNNQITLDQIYILPDFISGLFFCGESIFLALIVIIIHFHYLCMWDHTNE